MLRIPGKCNNICKSVLDVILSKILILIKGKVKLLDWFRIFVCEKPALKIRILDKGYNLDFSANEELWKEEEQVNGLGLSIFKEGFQQGVEQGIEQGIEQGVVQGAIRACQSFGKSKEDAVSWIQEKFSVSQENAITYVNQYWM